MAGIEEFLNQRQAQGLLRKLKPAALRLGAQIYFGKTEYIDFSSNDYLGLSTHPELKKVVIEAINKFGVASCASRLLSGDSELFHELEDTVAKLSGKFRNY